MIQNFTVFSGVMRVKGCFWTAAEPGTRVDYSVVGNTANLVINTMWAQVGLEMLSRGGKDGRFKDRGAEVDKAVKRLNADISRLKSEDMWHPVTHDRRVELVFIGDAQEMDEARIRDEIEKALLTQEEFDGFIKGVALKPAELDNPFACIPRCVKI